MIMVPHPEHDAMFNVEQNLFLLSVVSDEGMQGVTVGHPANQAGVGGQGDHCVALDADECNKTNIQFIVKVSIFLFFNLISTTVRVCKCVCSRCVKCTVPGSLCVCVCDALLCVNMTVCLPEVLAQGRRVVGQQCVDQTKQLHDSLILPQVFMALQQEHELVAITACRGRHKTQH